MLKRTYRLQQLPREKGSHSKKTLLFIEKAHEFNIFYLKSLARIEKLFGKCSIKKGLRNTGAVAPIAICPGVEVRPIVAFRKAKI